MVEFIINGTDITSKIDIQNYNVNRAPVFETWTDGNRREHRNKTRDRISGEFKVGFTSSTELATFTALLESARQPNGFFQVESSVNNMPGSVEYEAFLETEALGKYDNLNGRMWLEMVVTVTER